jgi:hypothetical protein
MSLATLGKVYLDENRFTSDPNIVRSWPPRRSRLLGIGGSTTQQDFGRFAKDLRLTLTSHELNLMNQSLVKTIEELMYVRRATYVYEDFEGIEGTVVIVDFDARPTYYKDGDGVLFDYQLVLDVVALTKLNFATYTGN